MASGLDSLKTTDAALDSGQKGLSSHLPSWAKDKLVIHLDNYPYFSKERVWARVLFFLLLFLHPSLTSSKFTTSRTSRNRKQDTNGKTQYYQDRESMGIPHCPHLARLGMCLQICFPSFALLTHKTSGKLILFFVLYSMVFQYHTLFC
ncbi:MAG: hypothetical protein BYD32DRAFT_286923 [Podila humilis]|nr:MAG: hypothetical protein BYD32DRAFT_286923 [Podila humilis]